jgi:hypothetical protein
MKSRTVLLLAGAVAALSTAAVALANASAAQAQGKAETTGPARTEDSRSEAEKRAARRAANEKRLKGHDPASTRPAPREEEEEEQKQARKP